MARRFTYSRIGRLDGLTGEFVPWTRPPEDNRTARERFIDSQIPGAGPRYSKQKSEAYKAFLRSQEYASRFPNGQADNYTINFPGIQDVIRIPSLEDRALRQQRYERWLRSAGTLPQPLEWIPALLNKLDDAQDLLFTGLALSIPLVKRLPAFFLRALTPAVLLNDVLNLLSCLLALGMGGAITKPRARASYVRQRSTGTFIIQRGNEFFSKFPWLGFLIQAPQAAITVQKYFGLPGYGLQLGTFMAAITDALWAPYRWARGQTVTFVGPPPDDVAMKAWRYISQPPVHYSRGQMFSMEDHLLLTAADIVATTILTRAAPADTALALNGDLAETEIPFADPWNPATLDVLAGDAWDANAPPRWPLPEGGGRTDFLSIMSALSRRLPAWMEEMAAGEARSELGQLFFYLLNDGGETVMEWLGGGIPWYEPTVEPYEDLVFKMIERGVFPLAPIAGEDIAVLSVRAQELATAIGETDLSADTLKRALNDVLGGYRAL